MDAKYADLHGQTFVPPEMTVDIWFEYWSECHCGRVAIQYQEDLSVTVGPQYSDGDRKDALVAVKPIHCKMIMNAMEKTCVVSSTRQNYITMGILFNTAKMNDLISKHPMDGVRYTRLIRAISGIKFPTVEE